MPFSGRSWDNRSKEHVTLSNRLGIRIIGLRTEWQIDPAPAVGAMPHNELVEKMPATWMSRSPCFIVEQKTKNADKFTDAALRAALAPEVADSTVIVVAQRISTVEQADRILVLEEGIVVGDGTHSELMRDSQVYREIAQSQLASADAA